ncbi:hypothetical protein CBL_10868 [Carabus blaptoides fortunei]
MENSASSETHNPEPEHIQKQETRHYNRSRGRPNRPYGDLRELLNQKRQNHNDPQGNGPPPEPSYNFLSDPLRDNELDSKNKDDRRSDNYGSGRFTPRQHNTVTFENRTRGGGRGRGRGNSYKKYEQPRYHGDNRRDDEWREERHRVDQERIQRQRSDSGGWKREWDAGKEDMWKEQPPSGSNKPQYSPQNRPAYSPHPDRRNKPPIARQEGDQPVQEQASPNQVENNQQNIDGTSSSQPRAPRKFNADRGGHQYRPVQKYNPNYNNSNRGARNFQKQVKSRRPNPINITVEFSAETGQRTCTIEKNKQIEKSKQAEKSKPVQKSRPKRNNSGKKGPGNVALVVDCEENWDNVQVDNKNDEEQNNDTATEEASDNHEGEDCGETEDTNEEQFDYETGDNENEEYDEADDRIQEQYDDAHIEIKEQSYKANDINNEGDRVKENDDIKKEEESKDLKTNVDDSKTDVETRNQTENKECDNSTKKENIVANTEEIATKEEDKMQNKEDSTNEIKNCDTENTGAIKEECNKEKLENETNAEAKQEKIEDKVKGN